MLCQSDSNFVYPVIKHAVLLYSMVSSLRKPKSLEMSHFGGRHCIGENTDRLTHTYCPPQITEMAFLNNLQLGQIVIAWPQIMCTKFEDEKGFIEDCKVWAKTGFILESRFQL